MTTEIVITKAALTSIERAQREFDRSQEMARQAGEAMNAVTDQVMKQHIKTGKALIKMEQDFKRSLTKPRQKMVQAGMTPEQIRAELPGISSLYLGAKTSGFAANPDGSAPLIHRQNGVEIGTMQGQRYKKIARFPHQARMRAKELRSYDPSTVHTALESATDEGEEPAKLTLSGKSDNHRALGTGENEWYTPEEWIERARSVMGGIDLDPALSVKANRRVKADRFFTKEDNGLTRPWDGRVWLNPPYSQPEIQQFCEKIAGESNCGNIECGIMLTHNYTDTKWFHIAAEAASAICFTRGRIGFLSPAGDIAAPTQGQALFYFGPDVSTFHEVFSEVGLVVMV